MSATGAYTLSSGTATLSSPSYTVSTADESALYVTGGTLTVTQLTVSSSAAGSNVDSSDKYGYAAGVLAASTGVISISGGTISTTGDYANGVFATGSGSITLSNVTVTTSGANAHGVDVTYGGSITLTNDTITTSNANSSVLATDYGGGTVTVTGGTYIAADTTSGSHSAGVYSTGIINVSNAIVTSYADNGAVVAAGNSISLTNDTVTGALNAVMAFSGGTPSSSANTILIDGGTLIAKDGAGILVNGVTANVTLEGGVSITDSSGYLLEAISSATATLVVDGQTVGGVISADSTSTVNLTIKNISGVSAISETITGTSMVIAANSGEAEIARLYEGALGREPDAVGVAYQWTAYGGNGSSNATILAIAGNFLGSSEFSSNFGTLSDAAFIGHLFTDALGRGASATDLAYYEAELTAGVSRAQILVAVTSSTEAVNHASGWLITL